MSDLNYEAEVKKVYPDAYIAYNNLFETYKVYENHRCENRIGNPTLTAYDAWKNAWNNIQYELNQNS